VRGVHLGLSRKPIRTAHSAFRQIATPWATGSEPLGIGGSDEIDHQDSLLAGLGPVKSSHHDEAVLRLRYVKPATGTVYLIEQLAAGSS